MSEIEWTLPVENVRRMAANLLVTDLPSAELLTSPPRRRSPGAFAPLLC
jgi:hypothetical protein